jgi:hypothetical protein
MGMGAEYLWNDMLNEFRALGGVAENIRIGHGPFGRGLFPIDPKQPVSIFIPEGLLVPLEDVYFENDTFRVHSRSPISARGRAFLEQYERDFAWGIARGEVERLLSAMIALPEHVRAFATDKLGLGRFFIPVVPGLVRKWFFDSRGIRSGSGNVVMPIIELANHGGSADYISRSGVSLSGTFDGEILVRYTTPSDPYGMFINWMFAPREPTAFSIPIQGEYAGRDFQIKREFEDEDIPFVPKVSLDEDRVVVSYLLLGHQRNPRVPKGAFRKALGFLKLDDLDEVYDVIQMANRENFLDLLRVLEGLDRPGATILRTLAINQLAALSGHYGIRTI